MLESKNILTKQELVLAKLRDANVPGAVVEFDPDEAELAGCFEENALTEEDAMEGVFHPDTYTLED